MRKKGDLKKETNSSVYRKLLAKSLKICPICKQNHGCNRNRDSGRRSWKLYRKNKWKL